MSGGLTPCPGRGLTADWTRDRRRDHVRYDEWRTRPAGGRNGNLADERSGFTGDIEPDEHATGEAVFDIHSSSKGLFPARAGLLLANLGDDVEFVSHHQVGVVILK
jgi:hypothetical protein